MQTYINSLYILTVLSSLSSQTMPMVLIFAIVFSRVRMAQELSEEEDGSSEDSVCFSG